MSAGAFYFASCAICGDRCHPNTPGAGLFGGSYLIHVREWAAWKARVPPDGWKVYDHKATRGDTG